MNIDEESSKADASRYNEDVVSNDVSRCSGSTEMEIMDLDSDYLSDREKGSKIDDFDDDDDDDDDIEKRAEDFIVRFQRQISLERSLSLELDNAKMAGSGVNMQKNKEKVPKRTLPTLRNKEKFKAHVVKDEETKSTGSGLWQPQVKKVRVVHETLQLPTPKSGRTGLVKAAIVRGVKAFFHPLKGAASNMKSKQLDQTVQGENSAVSHSKTLEVVQNQEEPEFFDCHEPSSSPEAMQSDEMESEFFDFDEPSSYIRQQFDVGEELVPMHYQQKRELVLLQGGMGLITAPKAEDWERSVEIYLMDNELSELPKNPSCPVLQALFLQRNCKLRKIPPLFFDHMPALEILNLSETRIKSLPESLFRLVNLRKLFLNNCDLLMTLSPKIGELQNLEVLDLEGTEISDLPKEVKKLTNLTSLELSFYEPMNHRTSEQLNAVIPHGILSALSRLEELNIVVSPDDERWKACVEEIVSEVCQLTALNTLKLYLPRVELLSLFTFFSMPTVSPSLSHFRFTVGDHAKRIMSRLPQDVEFELEQYDRCLKYINGVGVPEDIKMVLRHATAFFLDRHTTIKKLSDFGLQNMKQLRCFVLGECNELQVIGDLGFGFQSLEYVYIYYMKNLESIWTGSLLIPTLNCLKFLTLRTCPQLNTIFTLELLVNLCALEQLTVDDCPQITSLVSYNNLEHTDTVCLPNLRRISLHFLPNLTSIFSGLLISAKLEWMSFCNCPNLKKLQISRTFNENLQKIRGEMSWWKALEWESDQQHCWDDIFVPVDICD